MTALILIGSSGRGEQDNGENRANWIVARNSPVGEDHVYINLGLRRALDSSIPRFQAGAPGFEPGSKVPKTSVLPLHHAPREMPGHPSGRYCNTPRIKMTILRSHSVSSSGVNPNFCASLYEMAAEEEYCRPETSPLNLNPKRHQNHLN